MADSLQQDGRLEIHVPRPFTPQRPAVTYTRNIMDMNIEDHPLARTLPKATEGASIQADPGDFRAFGARENAPETLEDFTTTDLPQISLHVTSFNDATLVGLSWSHSLMDVMGQQALLHAWSLVLANREYEVPPMLGAREDALCAAAETDTTKEEFSLGKKQLKGWAMLMFGLRFAWDMLWNPAAETRTIFMPKTTMAALRGHAENDLAIADGGEGKPFVSDGDVLTAWATRAIASSLSEPRPMVILHAVNARFRVSSLLQASGVYVQNLAVAACTFLSSEVATGALGPLALENRRHLSEQATEAQVLACVRELQTKADGDTNILCGESNSLLVPFTNWTRAKIFETIDFAPAVVRAGEPESLRSNSPGTIVYHHAQSMRVSPAVRNVVVVLGKDHGNNYWLSGTLLPQAWAKIEEELNILDGMKSTANEKTGLDPL